MRSLGEFHGSRVILSINNFLFSDKSQLGLSHSYSRAKVKFNVNKSDNMIIQVCGLNRVSFWFSLPLFRVLRCWINWIKTSTPSACESENGTATTSQNLSRLFLRIISMLRCRTFLLVNTVKTCSLFLGGEAN